MKKLLFLFAIMLGVSNIQAQSVQREGMTFKSVTKASKAKADTFKDSWKWVITTWGLLSIGITFTLLTIYS